MGAVDPDLFLLALKLGGVGGIVDDALEVFARGLVVFFLDEEGGVLDAGAGVGMEGEEVLPAGDGAVDLPGGGLGLGERHQGVAVVVLGVFRHHALQQRQRFRWALGPQQALAEMRARVDVLRVAFHGCAVTFLCLLQFALLEINIPELRVVMRLVEMMDLRLKLLDAPAVHSAGQFEAAGCGWCVPVNEQVIKER